MYINPLHVVTVELKSSPIYDCIDSGQGLAVVPTKKVRHTVVVTDTNGCQHDLKEFETKMEALAFYEQYCLDHTQDLRFLHGVNPVYTRKPSRANVP